MYVQAYRTHLRQSSCCQVRFRNNELPSLPSPGAARYAMISRNPFQPYFLWSLTNFPLVCKTSKLRELWFSIWLQPLLHHLFTRLPPLLNFHSTSGWTDSTASSVPPLYSTKSPGSYADLCYRLTVWPLDVLMLFIRFAIDKNLQNPMGTLQGFINECLPFILYPKIKGSRMRNSITAGS